MPSIITCPECEKRFKGKPGLEGKRIRCPACSHAFIVPEEDEADLDLAERLGATIKPKNAVKKPKLGGGISGDERKYGVTDLDLSQRCPNCTKEMEDGAIICLFCGYNTQTRALGQTTKTIEKSGGEHFLHLLPGLAVALCMVILVISNLYFCFEVPNMLNREDWSYSFAHESVKFWSAMISLGLLWGLGTFCYKRLILEPKPPEDIKE
jgi:hypothetical protein